MAIPATEDERDPCIARDRVRRIMMAQVETFLSVVLFTPLDKPISAESLFNEIKNTVLPEVRAYRARLK